MAYRDWEPAGERYPRKWQSFAVSCMSVMRETRRVGMRQWWTRSPHHWIRFGPSVICWLSFLLVLVLLQGFVQFDQDRGHASENKLSLMRLRIKILYWVSCQFLLDLMFLRVLWDTVLPGRSGISGFWEIPPKYPEPWPWGGGISRDTKLDSTFRD